MIKMLSQATILVVGALAMGGCTLNQQARTATPVAKAAAADYQAPSPPSPPAGNIRANCYSAADMATVHGRMLQAELNVAYLQCQNAGGSRAYQTHYQDFVTKYSAELAANSRALSQVAARKRLNVDVFVTEMFNRAAQRAPVDKEFCSRVKRAFDWSMDPKVTTLAQIPPPYDLGPEMNIYACPSP